MSGVFKRVAENELIKRIPNEAVLYRNISLVLFFRRLERL